jgi:ankyrin repeat protein
MTTPQPGWTPLHEAALQSDAANIEALLAEGADANVATAEMLSSLPGTQIRRPKGATFYVLGTAQLSRPGLAFDAGATPLHVAAAVGSVAILELLKRSGAKVTALDGVGASALHYAALHGHAEALSWLRKTKLKVDAGVRVRKSIAFFDKGMTALHAALESGAFEAVEELLGAGADIKAVTAYGCTSLFFAARGGEVQTLETIKRAGIALDAPGEYLNDPLIECVERGHHDFAAELLKHGAKSAQALWHATKRGDARMRELLLDAGAAPLKHRGIADAAGTNDIAAVREMLAAGTDVNAVLDGATALMRACRDGHVEVVEVLLAAGARLDAEGKRSGPLHLAIDGNRHALALRLIEAGANLDALDEHGNTPLFIAVMRRGTEACIEAMIERGANPYQRMRHGNWAMKVARESAAARVALLEKTQHRDDPTATGWLPPDVATTTLTFTPGARWQDTLNKLFEQLVPPSGEANSVQGELVRCSNKLVDEAMRNGNGNFDAFHRGLGHFLERLLTEPFSESEQAALRNDIKALTRGTLDGATHRRVAEAVVCWCVAHPRLIALS